MHNTDLPMTNFKIVNANINSYRPRIPLINDYIENNNIQIKLIVETKNKKDIRDRDWPITQKKMELY